MQLKTADHRYSNDLEPILNPTGITIPPNDRITLNDGNISIPLNNFTDQPYTLKKGLQIANFTVITP